MVKFQNIILGIKHCISESNPTDDAFLSMSQGASPVRNEAHD